MGNIRIGNYTITDKDIDQFISTLPQEQQMYRGVPEFRDQVSARLEELCYFAMLGEEEKLEESEEYKEAMAAAKRDILSQLAMAKLLENITVSDEEARNYFESNKQLFAKQSNVTAKHILVDSEEKAKGIKKEIEAGAKSFEEAAKEYSSCPSGAKGGSLGTFGRGQMVKEFEEAAFNGEIATIIGPVATQFGYHLIFVDEKNEGAVPEYSEASSQVKARLKRSKQNETYESKLAELRGKYK